MKQKLLTTQIVIALVFGTIALASTSHAQSHPGQQKLLAKRAAEADAYRNLLERIKGLKIDSKTTVQDFVTTSDQIQTSLSEWIKGAATVEGSERWDGEIYEIQKRVSLEQVVQVLEDLVKKYPNGKIKTVQTIRNENQIVDIIETGKGSIRGDSPSDNAGPPSGVTGSVNVVPKTVYPGWENVTGQGRLMAERAATVDALRRLTERVQGVKLTSNTTVRDFVAEADFIQTSLDGFIKGARKVGSTRYNPDQTAEVDMEVTIQEVIKWLVETREQVKKKFSYSSKPWVHPEFETIKFEESVMDFQPPVTIRETGSGVPPAKYIKDQPSNPSGSNSAKPAWAREVLTAIGSGYPQEGTTGGEAKLSAIRAAELDARRNLSEKLFGVQIKGQTTIKDFVTQKDEVSSKLTSILSGSELSEPVYLDDGTVQVTASIPLEKVWKSLSPHMVN